MTSFRQGDLCALVNGAHLYSDMPPLMAEQSLAYCTAVCFRLSCGS
uniref:Uncharacterized protein n=1 Tax=Zea mays TaxID=4577 RepID=C4J0E2_MAIZE|nr:unknown [Zea mays]